jgi:DNA uptake protein ComE-like DNA-binding protein
MRIVRFLLSSVLALALTFAVADQTANAQAKKAPSGAKASKSETSHAGSQVDINSATLDELKSVPGIGDAYANKIIAGRPYKSKSQLKSKGVLPEGVYDKVKDNVIAKQKN